MNILSGITKNIKDLSNQEAKELQRLLNLHGYNLTVDGIVGPATQSVFRQFKEKNNLTYPDVLGETTLKALTKPPIAKAHDFSNREGVIKAICSECDNHNLPLKTQKAYVIATTEWETAKTFKPVKEAYWLSEDWRKNNLRYYPYYGRGFVQITWRANYQKYSQILGADLLNNPDKVLDPNISLFILVHGFKTGAFTGRKIEDYITNNKTDYINARRVINGTDKAGKIAQLAIKWEKQL